MPGIRALPRLATLPIQLGEEHSPSAGCNLTTGNSRSQSRPSGIIPGRGVIGGMADRTVRLVRIGYPLAAECEMEVAPEEVEHSTEYERQQDDSCPICRVSHLRTRGNYPPN
jgi:hypothetical protein